MPLISKQKIDSLGVSKHRLAGQSQFVTQTGQRNIIYAGVERRGQSGVIMILTKIASTLLHVYNPTSDRFLAIRMKSNTRVITVVQVVQVPQQPYEKKKKFRNPIVVYRT